METNFSGSYVRLKNEPTKIYKITSVTTTFADATQKDGKRVLLHLDDLELANPDEIYIYEDKASQIEY